MAPDEQFVWITRHPAGREILVFTEAVAEIYEDLGWEVWPVPLSDFDERDAQVIRRLIRIAGGD